MQPDENTPEEPQNEPENTSLAKEPAEEEPETEPEPETFARSYVEELRQENGKSRQRAHRADEYAQRLHTELVRATGRLADPTDLPFNEEHLDSPDVLAKAVDELLSRKPHLASRRPTGQIGQGATPSTGAFDLAALLRQRVR